MANNMDIIMLHTIIYLYLYQQKNKIVDNITPFIQFKNNQKEYVPVNI
jgi:hypothetical protein